MKIVIIGGGTAGWSCSAALSKNKNLDITIIDPLELSSIGVGESTLPIIRQFHKTFSLFDNEEWLKRVNGTLKYTLEFKSFLKNVDSKWLHPLSVNKEYEQFISLQNIHLNNIDLCNNFFYSQKLKNSQYQDISNYNQKIGAFHIDAELYMKELKNISLKREVRYINDVVKTVIQEEEITKELILENGLIIKGDLFIDCTGFKNILFKNLKHEFESFSNRLFCDKAIAIKLDYNNEKKQKSNATIAKALNNGWVWQVPLNNKIGFGYVFSSKHTNRENAQNEFIKYLKESFNYDINTSVLNFIEYRAGVHKRTWIGNNIAIGLSSFFIEPLEATGIALFQVQIMELAKILDTNPIFFKNYKKKYNQTIYQHILSVKDFIEMHYIRSNRKDTKFWTEASSITPNDFQQELLEMYEKGQYKKLLTYDIAGIFGNLSWLHLLMGMDETKR